MSEHIRDDDRSNPSRHDSLTDIVDRAIAVNPQRRRLMLGGLGAATLPFFSFSLAACGGGSDGEAAERMLGFTAVAAASGDTVVVPAGYTAQVIAPWGAPIDALAPAFKADASNTAAEQEQQIGDNHDGMAFFGFNAAGNGFGNRSDEGLLVFNHEYINPEYFYAVAAGETDWTTNFTLEKARKGQAGHGGSIVHVRRNSGGAWEQVLNSPYNRRIHGNTPMTIQGPARGNDLMKTEADPGGIEVLGMLNNCGNGRTPWGTYLTCEENFNGYFGWNGPRTPSALENRYGLTAAGFGYRWHTVDPRFDLNANENEPNRFGWIVEIDPFSPSSKPIKRTALGRFKHENAELVVASDGKVVVYMGCDERNEYLYKFVSTGTFDAANPTSAANRRLLESGTLYVAKFAAGSTLNDNMGTGTWVPLVFGENGLTTANGFANQGDVMIRSRQASDFVGATMMDRPEWVAANPKVPGEVFVTLTNNNRRGGTTSNNPDGSTAAGSARPPVDEANPRSNNVWGHIVRWNEAGGNASALSFNWDIFVLAGQPSVTGARAPSANVTADNLFNSPDGLAFDSFGRMWIQTDGNYSNAGDFANMGNNQMLVADPATKEIRRFLVGPSGCEVTGITWTPDRKTMFVNIQHPGEVGSGSGRHPRISADQTDAQIAANPTMLSSWPASQTAGATPVRPRAATVVVRRSDGGVIGG
ncbi:PhoX family phosphatase [Piscinibacter sp. Jin2]|uniref:PhoX family phosphatase n=1 Tax=Aquariibacter lacus TaxID=2801332 RepID=A0A9X0XH36_9BURK|nr:PhoX family phosphatase [Piscinibacter lacus]MBL0720821.1 PhoX family phosphatase [Piscinibacter lacus]